MTEKELVNKAKQQLCEMLKPLIMKALSALPAEKGVSEEDIRDSLIGLMRFLKTDKLAKASVRHRKNISRAVTDVRDHLSGKRFNQHLLEMEADDVAGALANWWVNRIHEFGETMARGRKVIDYDLNPNEHMSAGYKSFSARLKKIMDKFGLPIDVAWQAFRGLNDSLYAMLLPEKRFDLGRNLWLTRHFDYVEEDIGEYSEDDYRAESRVLELVKS